MRFRLMRPDRSADALCISAAAATGLTGVTLEDFTGSSADRRGLRLLEEINEIGMIAVPDAVLTIAAPMSAPAPVADPCSPQLIPPPQALPADPTGIPPRYSPTPTETCCRC